MGAYLADALRRRLARQEADGDTEGAKATEKRLKAVEKADTAAVADVEAEPDATEPAAPAKKTAAKKTAAKEK